MKTLGNILWFVFGGFLSGLAWIVSGVLWCITIIGIPYGVQCFKFASMSFFPFGKTIQYGTGAVSLIVNIIWVIFFGWEMALGNAIIGCLWCITIVGIPFGKQFFKIAKLSLMPFGSEITKIYPPPPPPFPQEIKFPHYFINNTIATHARTVHGNKSPLPFYLKSKSTPLTSLITPYGMTFIRISAHLLF